VGYWCQNINGASVSAHASSEPLAQTGSIGVCLLRREFAVLDVGEHCRTGAKLLPAVPVTTDDDDLDMERPKVKTLNPQQHFKEITNVSPEDLEITSRQIQCADGTTSGRRRQQRQSQ
jgi:hypothetical protein